MGELKTIEERLKAALAGRYEFEREIGRGGMATVYLAKDLKHGRSVAVKVLNEDVAFTDAPHRFLREIQVTAGFVHPHILPLLDSDTVDGLHYYVMPFVKGETLKERLARDGPLPVEHAVGITCEVADALGHAHRHHLIHRDIKPGNILLEGDHVFLADFGIVCPLDATGPELTREGSVVGTPFYQSPEQWAGRTRLDGRSDLYSLGCVLFEMLTGEPPFRGPSPEVVAGKHLHERPPPARLVRSSVPTEVDQVLLRALAKEPGDRFNTAEEFAEALQDALHTGASTETREAGVAPQRWWGRMGGALVMVGLAGVIWLGREAYSWLGGGGVMAPDTTRFWVVDASGGMGREDGLDLRQRMSLALERWNEITVAGPLPDEGAVRRGEPGRASGSELAALASEEGVGRVIWISAGVAGSDYRINAELLNTGAGGERLGSASVLIPRTLERVDSILGVLVDRLLFRDGPDGGGALPGTTVLASQHAFLEGAGRLAGGDLAGADSAFSQAVERDPHYARAHLMVALTRFWRGLDPPQWQAEAQQAALGTEMSNRDRILVEAILAQGQGRDVEACEAWERLTEVDPGYYGGWLGAGICLEEDGVVLPDPESPSGWSFRTSYSLALRQYRQAFGLFPQILASFRRGSYAELRSLFMTAANTRRVGHSDGPGNPIQFLAVPAWEGDTLALVPYPMDAPGIQLTVEPRARDIAVHRQRRLLNEVILGWVAALPDDPDANEAQAITLSLLGDTQALSVIHQARSLALTAQEELRLAGVEAWLQLAFALPQDADGVRRARVLADSVLSTEGAEHGLDPLFLTALAALSGRAHQAAILIRRPGVAEEVGAPPPLRETAPPLLIYAALGGPADSLDALEARVRTGIEEALPPDEQQRARWMWLARPATLAFFSHRMEALQTLRGSGDWLLDLQAAFAAGDSMALRAGFRELREARAGMLPSNVTMDGLLPEAELLVLMNQTREAADLLDPALRALPQSVPLLLTDPTSAAALVRAAALRASIALRMNDEALAEQWHEAVKNLWANADPFLKDRLSELDSLLQ